MNQVRFIKFIAPKAISVNGRQSSCECTDTMTCPYCIQASLLGFDKRLKDNDTIKKNLVSRIKRRGIRKVARELNTQASSVQYWFKTENFPQWVLAKYADCTNPHTITQGA